MRSLVVALLLAVAPVAARAQYAPAGPVNTYEFYGCLAGKSCHRVTWEVAEIAIGLPGNPYTLGARFKVEHWFQTPTFMYRAYVFPFPGLVSYWEDMDFANVCNFEFLACTGYHLDYANYQQGFIPIRNTWSISEMSFAIKEFDLERNDQGRYVATTSYVVPLTAVPEPSTLALCGSALLAIAAFARRRRRRRRRAL